MTVLVTGGNGYLGYETVQQLRQCDQIDKLYVLLRDATYRSMFTEDVKTISPKELFEDQTVWQELDILCHLASSRQLNDVNNIFSSLEFSNQLILLAQKHQLSKIIFSSSQAVYGQIPLMWQEKDEPQPVSLHGKAKKLTEDMLESIHLSNSPIQVISLRFSKIIGPSRNFRFEELPHQLCKYALSQQHIRIDNIEQQLDYIDIRDAASVIVKLITQKVNEQVINVSAHCLNLESLLKMISILVKKEYHLDFKYETKHSGNARNFGMSTKRLEQTLNWKPKYTLEQTLHDTMKYILKAHS